MGRRGCTPLDVDRATANARPSPLALTKLSGRGQHRVVAGRTQIAFTSEVYPECRDDRCNAERDDAREKKPVCARASTMRCFYRHWTSWSRDKRSRCSSCHAAARPGICRRGQPMMSRRPSAKGRINRVRARQPHNLLHGRHRSRGRRRAPTGICSRLTPRRPARCRND